MMRLFSVVIVISVELASPLFAEFSHYDRGIQYLLEEQSEAAMSEFRQSQEKGEAHANQSRIQLVRLLVKSAAQKESRANLAQIRTLLDEIDTPQLMRTGWYSALNALYDRALYDDALEVAADINRRYHNDEINVAARYFSARVYKERGRLAAALEQLYQILELHQKIPNYYIDDAYYLLGEIYKRPGRFYSPQRSRRAFEAFIRFSQENAFKDSIWRPAALSELSE